MVWILTPENSEVTGYYLDTIAAAFRAAGVPGEAVPSDSCGAVVRHASRADWFVCSSPLEAFRLLGRGITNIVLWCQGVIPEESYMRNGSAARRALLSLVERIALSRARFCLFVSSAMREHYERKYRLGFEGKCFVMPCFNTGLSSRAFQVAGKYDRPVFAYVGSLAKWQCFSETVELYRRIETRLEGSKLKVLTFSVDDATKALQRSGAKNYEVKRVSTDQVADELAEASFGFVIRRDDVVNRVATPTKISSYMSAGVIPVFSECLSSFSELAKGLDYALPVGEEPDAEAIAEYCARKIDPESVLGEYSRVFDSYFSRGYYVERLSPMLGNLVGKMGADAN